MDHIWLQPQIDDLRNDLVKLRDEHKGTRIALYITIVWMGIGLPIALHLLK